MRARRNPENTCQNVWPRRVEDSPLETIGATVDGETFGDWRHTMLRLKREEDLAREVAREITLATGINVDWRILAGRVRRQASPVTAAGDKPVMRWPLPTVAKELYGALHRSVQDLDLRVTTGDVSLVGPESFTAFEVVLDDVDAHDQLRPAALERVRGWASGLARKINYHAPEGVLWGVSLVLETRPLVYSATLYVQWSIVPIARAT